MARYKKTSGQLPEDFILNGVGRLYFSRIFLAVALGLRKDGKIRATCTVLELAIRLLYEVYHIQIEN